MILMHLSTKLGEMNCDTCSMGSKGGLRKFALRKYISLMQRFNM